MQVYDHHYHIEIKGVSLKRISHFSDAHLTTWDALSPEAEVQKAIERTAIWVDRTRAVPEPHVEPVESLNQYKQLLQAASETDALVLSGDVMDYVSGGNARAMERGIEQMQIPVLAVCGNHERAGEIPDGLRISMMKQPVYSLDLGDLLLVGVNNGERVLTRAQLESLRELFHQGKPVILVMHIPLVTAGNLEYMTKRGPYCQFNCEGCPEEVLEFIDMITAPDSPVAAVLAGHLHATSISEIKDGLYQYCVPHGIGGHMNIYTVGQTEEN